MSKQPVVTYRVKLFSLKDGVALYDLYCQVHLPSADPAPLRMSEQLIYSGVPLENIASLLRFYSAC